MEYEVLEFTSETDPKRARRILLIGSIPSATAARAPLASIIERHPGYSGYCDLGSQRNRSIDSLSSPCWRYRWLTHVSHLVAIASRWDVERYRRRGLRYALERELGVSRQKILSNGVGLFFTMGMALKWGVPTQVLVEKYQIYAWFHAELTF